MVNNEIRKMGIKSHQIMEFTLHDRRFQVTCLPTSFSMIFPCELLGTMCIVMVCKKLGVRFSSSCLGSWFDTSSGLSRSLLRRLATWKSKTNRTKERQFPLGKSCPKLSCSRERLRRCLSHLCKVKLIAQGHTSKDGASKLASPKHP